MDLDAIRLLLQVVNTGGVVGLLLLWVASFASGKITTGTELSSCRRERDRYLRQLLACKIGKGIDLDDDDDESTINGIAR